MLPGSDPARALADRLAEVGYTVDEVRNRLGGVAASALDREQVVPARRALLRADDALAVAVRLFLLGDPVPEPVAAAALGSVPGRWEGLLTTGQGQVRSAYELAPYAADDRDWLVVSDWSPGRTGRPARPDLVLGVGGASTMLAQCTVRPLVPRALDVGTGCGVQALHLTGHCGAVVATDVSARCLEVTAFNAALNGVELELRRGSLLDPVAAERFDLIVSNPPFVVSPRRPGGPRLDYRDAGLVGDEVCERLVGGVERVLADGGWCQLLANWEVPAGQEWWEGPQRWLSGCGLDAWVVQREVLDPASYAELWLRDSGEAGGPDFPRRYDEWLADFEARGVAGVGFGLVTLRRSGHGDPVRRFQHAGQSVRQPLGPHVERWFAAQDLLRAAPGAQVLTLALRTADDVRVDERYAPRDDEPLERAVVRETGFRWSGTLDAFGASVLAGCDGSVPVGEVVAGLAAASGLDARQTLAASVPVVRRLLEEGFLEPAR